MGRGCRCGSATSTPPTTRTRPTAPPASSPRTATRPPPSPNPSRDDEGIDTVTRVADPPPEKKDRRPSTAHLKVVPETRELRDRVRAEAGRFCAPLDRARPLTRDGLRQLGEEL